MVVTHERQVEAVMTADAAAVELVFVAAHTASQFIGAVKTIPEAVTLDIHCHTRPVVMAEDLSGMTPF